MVRELHAPEEFLVKLWSVSDRDLLQGMQCTIWLRGGMRIGPFAAVGVVSETDEETGFPSRRIWFEPYESKRVKDAVSIRIAWRDSLVMEQSYACAVVKKDNDNLTVHYILLNNPPG